MKILIDLDDLPVDEKGEALRAYVFNQHQGKHWLRGCYTTFDVNDGFVEIDPNKYPKILEIAKPGFSEYPLHITAYENDLVVAMWWWDGDGDLTFWIKGEKYALNNSDCKKDYIWEEVEIS